MYLLLIELAVVLLVYLGVIHLLNKLKKERFEADWIKGYQLGWAYLKEHGSYDFKNPLHLHDGAFSNGMLHAWNDFRKQIKHVDCNCGNPDAVGVTHTTDGKCYWTEYPVKQDLKS